MMENSSCKAAGLFLSNTRESLSSIDPSRRTSYRSSRFIYQLHIIEVEMVMIGPEKTSKHKSWILERLCKARVRPVKACVLRDRARCSSEAFFLSPSFSLSGFQLWEGKIWICTNSSWKSLLAVVSTRKWKEVTAVFSFTFSATNASFILRKYYVPLLYHYEQTESALSAQQTNAAAPSQQQANTAVPEVSSAPLAAEGSPVCGVIDGNFESGYLITVKIGFEDFKSVLYQVSPSNEARTVPNQQNLPQMQMGSVNFMNQPPQAKVAVPRRKRRKKCEIKKRDPSHLKPNRNGYNFFFV